MRWDKGMIRRGMVVASFALVAIVALAIRAGDSPSLDNPRQSREIKYMLNTGYPLIDLSVEAEGKRLLIEAFRKAPVPVISIETISYKPLEPTAPTATAPPAPRIKEEPETIWNRWKVG